MQFNIFQKFSDPSNKDQELIWSMTPPSNWRCRLCCMYTHSDLWQRYLHFMNISPNFKVSWTVYTQQQLELWYVDNLMFKDYTRSCFVIFTSFSNVSSMVIFSFWEQETQKLIFYMLEERLMWIQRKLYVLFLLGDIPLAAM